MIVRTNMSSLNSCRHLNKNNKKSSKNLEKLASGYRINMAADDASGLAITEQMRSQITALTTVTDGCEDGVNLVRTTEGYLNEVQDILVRMTELTMKSANGILEDEPDRAALQEEMNHLGAEIDRIADTANFNNNKLFSPKIRYEMVSVAHETPIYQTVTGSKFFSLDSDNYIEDNNSTILGAKEQARGDTLIKIADAIKRFMEAQRPPLTDMIDGKVYYNKDGSKIIVDAPPTLTQDQLAAEFGGNDYFSATTHSETYIAKFSEVKPPEGRYTSNLREEPHPPEADRDPVLAAKIVEAIEKKVEEYTHQKLEEGEDIMCLKGKAVYYNADLTQLYIADQDESFNPGTGGLYRANLTPILPSGNNGNGNGGGTYTGHHSNQSFVSRVDVYYTQEIIPHEYFTPITLQVGETSDKPDKLPVQLFDIHTEHLFREVRELLGYYQKEVYHEPTPPTSVWDLRGTMRVSNGNASFTPGTDGGYEYVDDLENPLYHVEHAIRNNTEYTGREESVTLDISNNDYAIGNVLSAREVTDRISLMRGYYGAIENRLEHIVNNHENTVENVSKARSNMKDTDMAKEMTKYTQNNILAQTAQAMLAQANTKPQDVLKLLQ